MKKPELLAPAGDMERLRFALHYGADAVYAAYQKYGMRAACSNFDMVGLKEAITLCHQNGRKFYLTVNVYPTVEEMKKLADFFAAVAKLQPDAFIIADVGVIALARQYAPNVAIHVSTQANVTNAVTANEYARLGASRVVLAREVSLAQIREIRKALDPTVEIECFVHGAMCMSVSGRCHLSAMFTGRDANRGACAQPCRWEYAVMEKTREGQYFPVEQDDKGTYIFNSKDLCMIEHIGELIDAGVDSFKIEGRMKTFYYVAATVKAYRQAIDEYARCGALRDPAHYLSEVGKASHRAFSTGFYFGPMNENGFNTFDGGYIRPYDVVATVVSFADGTALICQKNKFSVGDTLEVLSADGDDFTFTVTELTDENGTAVTSAPHAEQKLFLPCPHSLHPFDILRKEKPC